MKLSRIAGSLVLANISLALVSIGLACWGLKIDGALVVILWILLPPLLILNLAYLVGDLVRAATRRQAIYAVFLSLPAYVWDTWFVLNLKL